MTAEKSAVGERYFRLADEKAGNNLLRKIVGNLRFPAGIFDEPKTEGDVTSPDNLFRFQSEVIRELAAAESCVIVGRCADYILRENPDCLHVFIHADTKFRAERIVRLYGESEKSPELRLKDKDARRSANYKHFTGREWGQCRNYHLSLDSGVIGADNCVDLIVRLAAGKMLLTEE